MLITRLYNAYKVKRTRDAYHKHYVVQFKNYIANLGLDNAEQEGEIDYIKKWSVFGEVVEPFSYRLFSHFCGKTPDIVPEDIGHVRIESVLNPIRYRKPWEDKNLFDRVIGTSFFPETIIRRINGGKLLDKDYIPIDRPVSYSLFEDDGIVLKPSINSNSGLGVVVFSKEGSKLVSLDRKMTIDLKGGGK